MLGVVMNSLKGPDVFINQVRLSKILMKYHGDRKNFSLDQEITTRGGEDLLREQLPLGPARRSMWITAWLLERLGLTSRSYKSNNQRRPRFTPL